MNLVRYRMTNDQLDRELASVAKTIAVVERKAITHIWATALEDLRERRDVLTRLRTWRINAALDQVVDLRLWTHGAST